MMPEQDKHDKTVCLLGDLPPKDRLIRSTVVEQGDVKDISWKAFLDLMASNLYRPILLNPRRPTTVSLVCFYNHAHGGNYLLGKDELLLGRKSCVRLPYAQALTSNGWGALCIDTWFSANDAAGRSLRSSRKCSGKARSCGG